MVLHFKTFTSLGQEMLAHNAGLLVAVTKHRGQINLFMKNITRHGFELAVEETRLQKIKIQ